MRITDAISAGVAVGMGTTKRPGKMIVQPGGLPDPVLGRSRPPQGLCLCLCLSLILGTFATCSLIVDRPRESVCNLEDLGCKH